MKKIINALIDNGYELVTCRDHLYTFACGYVVVVVNTHMLTGGYALSVTFYKSSSQKLKCQKITSLTELYSVIRADKKLHKSV